VGDPLIYMLKGCVGETPFPSTDTFWEASLPQLITYFISQHSPLINLSAVYCKMKTPPKTLWEKSRKNLIIICHEKNPLKTSGKI